MELQAIAVSVDELEPGMTVCALDRPWLETPFRVQGFTIKDEYDIKSLQDACNFVYIEKTSLPEAFAPKKKIETKTIQDHDLDQELPQRKPLRYREEIEFETEIETAKDIQKQFSQSVVKLFEEISTNKIFDLKQLKNTVSPVVNSIVRNPNAMTWLVRLKSGDDYTYRHAMAVAVWSVTLGRQLGLPIKDLNELAIGALLCDIGKLQLPKALLTKPEKLSPEEFTLIKTHVDKGAEILAKCPGITKTVIDIVRLHHERYSGNGYPDGLSRSQIPIFARIVSITDCYEAITSLRPYAPTLSSSEAVKKLYEWRNVDFQHELVEEFIQAIGIYPTGSLVELSDNSIAIVVATGKEQRLRPKVMVILSPQKKPIRPLKVIDLMNSVRDADASPLSINRSLPNDAYGIDPEDYYI